MPYADITKKREKDAEYWQRVKKKGPVSATGALNRAIDIVKPLGDIKVPKHGLKIAVIPDVQAMPGTPVNHLVACGKFIADKRPDVIVNIGDFGDFPSLSRFGRGERQFEGRRYKKDLDAYHRSMEALMTPIAKVSAYHPWLEYDYGNHETHIERLTEEYPILEEHISMAKDLHPETYGWRVHDFMHPIAIGGVAFSHYFPSGIMGHPVGTAAELLRKLHMSCVAGHQPGRDIAYGRRADGKHMTAIIAGSFYQHDMKHLSPFTNAHWRGMYMLHEVRDGQFDEMAVSINYLLRRFG